MPTADTTPAIRGLATMAHALGRSASMASMIETAAEQARAALCAASVSLSRLDPETGSVRTLVNVGELGPHEERWPENEVYLPGQLPSLDRVLADRATYTADLDDPATDEADRDLLTALGKGSGMGSPVFVDGRLWGELYATRHRGSTPFSHDDIAYVEVLIAILGGAVSRAQREESLERLAYRDPLTGLLNRRGLDELAAPFFDVPSGSSRVLTVLALDLNDLKQVNDAGGHTEGDRFIRSVAAALEVAFADFPGSLVARVGGDEFTVLVSDHDPDLVVRAADEVCARSWEFVPGAGVSAGAATVLLAGGSGVTQSQVFAAADRAQYVAKRGRLSATVLSEDLPADSPPRQLSSSR